MKRQSIAEQTLTKQLRLLNIEEDCIKQDIQKLSAKLETIRDIIRFTEAERARLNGFRHQTSIKARHSGQGPDGPGTGPCLVCHDPDCQNPNGQH